MSSLSLPIAPAPFITLPTAAASSVTARRLPPARQSEYTMSKASNEMTEHAEQAEATYKPSEHGGLRQDGQPDKRMSSEHGAFASPRLAFGPPPPPGVFCAAGERRKALELTRCCFEWGSRFRRRQGTRA